MADDADKGEKGCSLDTEMERMSSLMLMLLSLL